MIKHTGIVTKQGHYDIHAPEWLLIQDDVVLAIGTPAQLSRRCGRDMGIYHKDIVMRQVDAWYVELKPNNRDASHVWVEGGLYATKQAAMAQADR